jgi:hypothetical protein
MTVWLERLGPSDLQVLLPQVLLTLDQMRDQVMEPERRLAMLRGLKDQVEAVQAALPVPRARPSGQHRGSSASPRPPTLEQRLACCWCSNLQRLLIELGQPRYRGHSRFAVYREWTLRQLLRGLGQAVEHDLRTSQRAATGLWRLVYDLFLYLEGRDELQGPSVAGSYRFNPWTELKRLFLVGVISRSPEGAAVFTTVEDRLRQWVEGAELCRGASSGADTRILRVDVATDEPPRWSGQGTTDPYNGWAMDVPKELIEFLTSVESPTGQSEHA